MYTYNERNHVHYSGIGNMEHFLTSVNLLCNCTAMPLTYDISSPLNNIGKDGSLGDLVVLIFLWCVMSEYLGPVNLEGTQNHTSG